MIGTRLGPYEIVARIGAGGMGEVYRARDTRLGRDVAIKVLPAEFASDPERLRRFEQEARVVASLSHPNVLAVYDVGTFKGSPFIVSELLEGETLRDRLEGEGFTLRKAIETAVQIAQGLAAAHEKGIIHRDLKPANVFITRDGQVKILDFGIAKLTRSDPGPHADTRASEPTTETGVLIGTVGYMSPEQVRGLPVDHRTDLFSLGCVLYEMVSGARPFARDTAADTMSAILNENPPPLNGTGKAIPPAVEEIVSRCLEKHPEDRFSTAHDLALALQAESTALAISPAAYGRGRSRRAIGLALAGVVVLAAAGTLVLKVKPAGRNPRAAGPPKIVVFPFENLGAPEDAYFATGMTDEITSRLANVRGLAVISRTTAVQYDRRGRTVKRIGSDLGVDYVLEGSVRWERGSGRESRVRITPQLIRVADDTNVWADRYDRVIADVFTMQSEVAENTVRAMGVTLLPHEKNRVREISTNDLEAYDLYLRGQEMFGGGEDRPHLDGAVQMFHAAVDRDPDFAQALAGLAMSHLSIYSLYYDRSQERLVQAKVAAARAVELRPDLAETHTAVGDYFYHGLLDYPRALSEFSAAIRIKPNTSAALELTSYVLRRQGRWAESAEVMRRALGLDPRNAVLFHQFGNTCVLLRRYADADRSYGLAIALSPQWAQAYASRSWLQVLWSGDVARAQAVLDESDRLNGPNGDIGAISVRLALLRRDYEGAIRQLEAATPDPQDGPYTYSPLALARGRVEMLAGLPDRARDSFEDARLKLERKVQETPDDSRLHSALGIAYAGLGRRAEAVREAKLGCDLMPVSKDAWTGPWRLQDLALVYTMVGEPTEAIAQLDELLARSGKLTPHLLRLDPCWDPLRSDPRFQALLAKYEVKP